MILTDDSPIDVKDITQMTENERDDLLIKIRERRLQSVKIYEELSLMKAEARKEQLEGQLDKALEMFNKDLIRVDKALVSLENRSVKLRSIELEIEQT
jgi:hypothetical protein|tara:strand:+ start:4910 stop:5203 length:294 start_codon:yes stop_codon:yes gene_type:complete